MTTKLQQKKNILLLGDPLAGKTRAAYQLFKSLNPPWRVIIPRKKTIDPTEFFVPQHFSKKRELLFLDDLDTYVVEKGFCDVLPQFLKRKNLIIVATCRSGEEFDNLCEKLPDISTWFKEPIHIGKITKNEATVIINKINMKVPENFDGNIGSLFIDIDQMRQRFMHCSDEEKIILDAMRLLYYSGLSKEQQKFEINDIKRVCKYKGMEFETFKLESILKSLEHNDFIVYLDKDTIQTEQSYLELVFGDRITRRQHIQIIKDVIDIFRGEGDSLLSVGNYAQETGTILIEISEFLHLSIAAYDEALKVRTLERFPIQYAMTQNNLGTAHRTLAEVEDKATNCKKAIAAYDEALKVYTLERFPIQYAMTQNNLGTAHSTLAEVEDKATNCKKAIAAYDEALKVLNKEVFPEPYAIVTRNLKSLQDFCI